MKRRLRKLSNGTFSITVPKDWVKKNRFHSGKTDLEVTDCGTSIMISKISKQRILPKQIIVQGQSQEEIIAKIAALYTVYKDVKIVFRNNNKEMIEKISGFVNNLHGVDVEAGENHLFLSENHNNEKSQRILKRCCQSIQVMTEQLNAPKKDNRWKQEICEIYKRTFFLTEYALRLINMEPYAETKMIMQLFSLGWTLQCIGEIIRRIAERETAAGKQIISNADAKVMGKLLRSVYNICYTKKGTTEFYALKNNIATRKNSSKRGGAITEDLYIFQYLCGKLVKQQMLD